MSNEEIQSMKQMLKTIDTEPWIATCIEENKKLSWEVQSGCIDHVFTIAHLDNSKTHNQEANAKFIASARQFIPIVIDEIERLKETIRQLQNGLQIAGE